MRHQIVIPQAHEATQEWATHPARLVVTGDKRLGVVGERVEVLPWLDGTVVMSYQNGCQVWSRSVDVQAWVAYCSE